MEKTKTNEDSHAIEADQTSTSNSQHSDHKASDEVELEQHVHIKTIILLIVGARSLSFNGR
jgi:hypothetical protein